MEIPSGDYCVYRHIRPDTNQPFYIGIGKPERPYTKSKRNSYWTNIVEKNNGEFIVNILHSGVTKQFAIQQEILLIKTYGRKNNNTGILCNMTDGGEGTTRCIASDLTKKRMSKARRGEIKRKLSVYIIQQIDLISGDVIQEFYGTTHVKRVTGVDNHSVWNCIYGIVKKAGGYNWKGIINPLYTGKLTRDDILNREKKYLKDHRDKLAKNKLKTITRNSKWLIEKIEPTTGVVIGTYCGIYQAGKSAGISGSSIFNAWKKGKNTAGGFRWEKYPNPYYFALEEKAA